MKVCPILLNTVFFSVLDLFSIAKGFFYIESFILSIVINIYKKQIILKETYG